MRRAGVLIALLALCVNLAESVVSGNEQWLELRPSGTASMSESPDPGAFRPRAFREWVVFGSSGLTDLPAPIANYVVSFPWLATEWSPNPLLEDGGPSLIRPGENESVFSPGPLPRESDFSRSLSFGSWG
jgi:hypothetical protein